MCFESVIACFGLYEHAPLFVWVMNFCGSLPFIVGYGLDYMNLSYEERPIIMFHGKYILLYNSKVVERCAELACPEYFSKV